MTSQYFDPSHFFAETCRSVFGEDGSCQEHGGQNPLRPASHTEVLLATVSALCHQGQDWTGAPAVVSKAVESKWAAPIVPVMKADDSVRLCGDYKDHHKSGHQGKFLHTASH